MDRYMFDSRNCILIENKKVSTLVSRNRKGTYQRKKVINKNVVYDIVEYDKNFRKNLLISYCLFL